MPSLPATSLRVATSDSARDLQLDEADFARLRQAVEQRVVQHGLSLRNKIVIVEQLSQGQVTLHDLRRHANSLDRSTYDDLVEERHSEGLCPYAACGNKASTAYDPQAYQHATATATQDETHASATTSKFKLRPDGGLYDAADLDRHGKGAYCSKECMARSTWYREKCVGTDRSELLEDVEQRRRQVAQSAKELERSQSKDVATKVVSGAPVETVSDDMSHLRIKERATSASEPPRAPSFNAPDFERPLPQAQTRIHSSSMSTPPSRPRKRPSATTDSPSLASFNVHLDTTTRPLKTSPLPKAVPSPPVRMPGQTDDEVPQPVFSTDPVLVDEQGREAEWAADLDDEGESEEVRAWMEQALEVRRLVREGQL
ncbi:hypothetical protein ACM66B_003598 [Microbotryomycetes sp. NB124-2]